MKPASEAPLGGADVTVEADETFVGGIAKNRATRTVKPKKAVVSLIERDGRARSFHVANVHSNNIKPLLFTNVDRSSHLRTDGAVYYRDMSNHFASHAYVDHGGGEYARGDVHSNTAENFFSILKRGVIGTYHHWSQCHLHRYLAEFDFRYNTKDVSDRERADEALKGIAGKRLTYRRTAALTA